MVALVLLVVIVVFTLAPLCLCAVAARRDAMRNVRRFGHRIFYAALLNVFGFFVLAAIAMAIALQIQRGSAVGLAVDWAGMLLAAGFVFLFAAFTGAIGYAVSYRLYDARADRQSVDLISPYGPVDETGNPYQPPSR